MRRDFGQLAKLTLIYGSGTVVAQLAAIILLPVYSRVLLPADYGILAVVNVVVSIITPFLSLGLGNGLFRYYYEYESEEERRLLVRSCLVPVLVTCFTIIGLMWLSVDAVVGRLFTEGDYTPYMRVGLATAFFMGGAIVPRYTLRIQQQATWYVALSLGQLLLTIALGIFLVVVQDQGVMGVLYAGLIGSAVAFVVINAITLRRVELGPVSLPMTWRCLRFGIFLVPDALAAWTINLADRWFLERYASRAELGLYSVGYRFGQGVQIVAVAPLEQAIGPYALANLKRPDFRALFARIFTYATLGASFVGLLIAVNGDNLVRLLTVPAYYAAATVIPLVALAYALELTNWLIGYGLVFAEKPKLFFAVTLLGAAVNLGANWLLVPQYGMMGAAYSTLLAFAVMCVANYVLSQALYPVRYEYGRVARVMAIAFGLFALGLLASLDNLAANFVLQTSMAFALFPALVATGFLTREERGTIGKTWTAIKARRPWALGRV